MLARLRRANDLIWCVGQAPGAYPTHQIYYHGFCGPCASRMVHKTHKSSERRRREQAMVMGNRQTPGICGFDGLWHIRSLISGRNEKRLPRRERTNSIPVLSYKICLVHWSIYVAKAGQQTT